MADWQWYPNSRSKVQVVSRPASRVEGRQLISSANPQIRVKVDASLKYLGVVPFSIDDLAAGHR
jgi:hypothetical protein